MKTEYSKSVHEMNMLREMKERKMARQNRAQNAAFVVVMVLGAVAIAAVLLLG
jgi:type IV secretory pathway component VirB8